jgi:hypothetical protein
MASNDTFSSLESLREIAISEGSVFIGPWADIDHEKFVVIVGVEAEKVLVCTVLINSKINQYILKRPKMLACQVEVKADNYDFLSHNSYINCAQPFKAKFEHFKSEEFKYCGLLSENDFAQVKQCVINSGALTEEEIKIFFSK